MTKHFFEIIFERFTIYNNILIVQDDVDSHQKVDNEDKASI